MTTATPHDRSRTLLRGDSFRPARVARVLLAVTLVLALLGAVSRLAPALLASKIVNLDDELTVPAVYSTFLLLGAGCLGLLLPAPVYRLFGVGLLAMAADELFEIHEWLETRLATDWQILYLPVFLVGAVLIVVVFVRARREDGHAGRLLVLGSACWAVSQILEKLQWEGDVQQPGYTAMMLTEETLEMLGTVGFLIALLILLRKRG